MIFIIQVGADMNTFLDDGEVLVKREAIYGSVCQLQQFQPVLFSLCEEINHQMS